MRKWCEWLPTYMGSTYVQHLGNNLSPFYKVFKRICEVSYISASFVYLTKKKDSQGAKERVGGGSVGLPTYHEFFTAHTEILTRYWF